MAGIELDFTELERQSQDLEKQLTQLLHQLLERLASSQQQEAEVPLTEGGIKERQLQPVDEQRVEGLLQLAMQDRSRAYELKNELDRLGIFKDYEDRFHDLFRP